MCPPDYFGVEYEINAWMDKKIQPDAIRAKIQWNALLKTYLELGLDPWFMGARHGLPDMCFTANAGWYYKDRVVLANFKHRERRGEEAYIRQWFNAHQLGLDLQLRALPPDIAFEGQGDVVVVGPHDDPTAVLMGWGTRTDKDAARELERFFPELKGRIYPIRHRSAQEQDPKKQEFYHLDTCCAYIPATNTLLYYPDAFDLQGLLLLRSLPCDMVPVTEEEARRFVCNAVAFGDVVIVNAPGERLKQELAKRGLRVIELDTSEFQKAGGSVRCLTLFLSKEKAE